MTRVEAAAHTTRKLPRRKSHFARADAATKDSAQDRYRVALGLRREL